MLGVQANAQHNWGNIAFISGTMGVSANRLCLGESTRGDIGCPTYAPTVDSAGLLTAPNISITTNLTVVGSMTAGSAGFGPIAATYASVTAISATGNISANQFIGDGSLLTNINASQVTGLSSDRISSTNNQAMAVATSAGTVSFTLGGTQGAAYLHPSLGLVAAGVSTTGGISGSTGYFNGKVGIGLSSPSATLHVNGDARISGSISLLNVSGNSALRFTDYGQIDWATVTSVSGSLVLSGAYYADNNSSVLIDEYGRMMVDGIGVPKTTLHVSGTLRIADGGEACDADRAGAIKYASSTFYFCRGSAWQSLGDIAAASSDRITSGTTNVYARADGSISFTTAGTTTGYFYNGKLVANGISTTGVISASSVYAGNWGTSGSLVFRDKNGILSSDANFKVINTSLFSTNAVLSGEGSNYGFNSYWSNDNNRYESVNPGYAAFIRMGMESASEGGDIQFATVSSKATASGQGLTLPMRMVIKNSGLVGVATTLPSTTLHVLGTLRLADGGEACDSNRAGAIKYASGTFYFCSGSAWQSLSTVAAGGMALGNLSDAHTDDALSNISLGYGAGSSVQGSNSTAVGYNAGYQSSGTQVTFMGSRTGYQNKGDRITAVGSYAGYQNTGTYFVTSIGTLAGYQNSSNYLTVLGDSAGYMNAAGEVTAVGANAGVSNTASHTTVVGRAAGYANTGSRAISLGAYSLYNNTGNYVVGIGYNTGSGNTGSNLVAIGYEAGKDNAINNQFIVKHTIANSAPLIQGNFSTGNVGIGLTSPTEKFEVAGRISATHFVGSGSLLTDVPIKVAAPATASTACTTGQIAYDTSYAYFCVATNTWKRAALSTW